MSLGAHTARLAARILCGLAPLVTPTGPAMSNAFPGAVCVSAPYADNGVPSEAPLVALVGTLRDHAAAYPSLLRALDLHEPVICLEPRAAGPRGYFDVGTNTIALLDGLTDAQKLVVLIHELRHLDQVGRSVCPSDSLAMEEVARATFAMEADAGAVTAHVAFEAMEAGDGALWEALGQFPNYADIPAAYAAERAASGSAARAMGAAFAQWYVSDWRRDSYYLAACSDYLDRVDRTHRLPSYDLLDSDFYGQLCVMPDGSSYDCRPPDRDDRP
jgi:hypothetical protein